MRVPVCLVLLFIAGPVWSQQAIVNFQTVDRQIWAIQASTVEELSAKLTSPFQTNLEKTRAIFRWITENIEYNTRNFPVRKSRDVVAPVDDTSELKPLTERVADGVLKSGVAVCDGYARLFKSLCDHAGIPCEIVTGYANGDFGRAKFKSNHSWNAVYVDSGWHLLDVTWASGYVSYSGSDFIRAFNERYFFTAPEQFIKDHYPEDLQWTLLNDPPVAWEFRQSPFRYGGFVRQRVVSFFPASGVIECAIGDSLSFEIGTKESAGPVKITEHPYIDTSKYDLPEFHNSTKQKVIYVVRQGVEWLYVSFPAEMVLRYKIVMKPIDKNQ
jgi:hypothetical protein